MNNKIPGEVFFIRKQIKQCMKEIFTNKKDKVLDMGCGDNPFYKDVIKGKVYGFDIKPSTFTSFVGTADNLPFKEKSFDKIILANSLYYFDNPFKVIERIHQILKSKGTLFISIPFFYPIHDTPDDKYRFTEFGLKTILSNHFQIKEIKSIGGFFTIPSVILHSLIKGLPSIMPTYLKKLTKVFVYITLYIPYLLTQVLGLIDVIDKTKRWTTYYVVIATKK